MIIKRISQLLTFLLLVPPILAQEKLAAASIFGGVTDIGLALAKIIAYIIPIFAFLLFIMAVWFFVQRRKNYSINVDIYILTANKGLVKDTDKGAIVRMMAGGEELRLRKNRARLPVPPANCWLPNLGKGTSLVFLKVGRLDYHPLSIGIISKQGVTKDTIIEELKKYYSKSDLDERFNPEFWQTIDVKSKLEDVNIIPIKADFKSHLFLEAEENLIKHQRINKMKEYIPLIIIVLTLAFLTFSVVWHYKYVDILATKTIEEGKDYIEQCTLLINKVDGRTTPAPIIDTGEGNKPPLI